MLERRFWCPQSRLKEKHLHSTALVEAAPRWLLGSSWAIIKRWNWKFGELEGVQRPNCHIPMAITNRQIVRTTSSMFWLGRHIIVMKGQSKLRESDDGSSGRRKSRCTTAEADERPSFSAGRFLYQRCGNTQSCTRWAWLLNAVCCTKTIARGHDRSTTVKQEDQIIIIRKQIRYVRLSAYPMRSLSRLLDWTTVNWDVIPEFVDPSICV